jgi:lipopolysaccharide transport system ATP-binding protein
MSSEIAISVQELGKRYRLGYRQPFRTLRDALTERLRGGAGPQVDAQTLWALRDVSFDVPKGQALGIIGHNGAGKTTLLKILSRITDPTLGQAVMHGRTGSLLEVGTGFHPELTGRENIFMNGAILGMRRKEIEAKLDDIIEFSGVEQFIETPVKRYSTGMYVRLAFAVAAHLDTDILFVDEVLSVGDLGFQRRCLGKMQEQTSSEGRTVLFVSHNLGAIKLLTDQCLWMDHGQLKMHGPTDEVFRAYVASHRAASGGGVVDLSDVTQNRSRPDFPAEVTFESVGFRNAQGSYTDTQLEGEPFDVVLRLRARKPLREIALSVVTRIFTPEGQLLFPTALGPVDVELEPGLYETSFRVDPNPLGVGAYALELYVYTGSERQGDQGQDLLRNAATFYVETNPLPRDERYIRNQRPGLLSLDLPWTGLAEAGELELA